LQAVRVPGPSNKPQKEKINGEEIEEDLEEGSEEADDGQVVGPLNQVCTQRLDPNRGASFLECGSLAAEVEP
jgi:hypothetical protein